MKAGINGNDLTSPLAEYQPAFPTPNPLQPRLPPIQAGLQDFQLPFMTRSSTSTAPYGMRSQAAAGRKGGRRPREIEEKDYDLNDEEKDKRAKRRQRNKEAAARCRKRRLDLMESLQIQVDALREENRQKQLIIDQLTQQKNKLDEMLRHNCQVDNQMIKEDMIYNNDLMMKAHNGNDLMMKSQLKTEVEEYEHQQQLYQQRLQDMDMYKDDMMEEASNYAISSSSMLINNDPIISQAALKRSRHSPLPSINEIDPTVRMSQSHPFARPTSLPLSTMSQYSNEMNLPSITTPSSGLGDSYNLLNQQTFLTPLIPGAVPVPLHTPPHNGELRQL
ncbi:unnamed protein product [Bursaphelenchus okinawaensis]|uniref:BZIP domain-containing protein n=1 Tax=Bursaphelenchus okinawaensis TaxID=465554 RepID=A0A811L4E1_9BILA|nr:unnamed protein product [Bursaphelenchus okinawaensis]CAG9117076.1 unnamed protein product [Bursaphelenchus okinawaensis]